MSSGSPNWRLGSAVRWRGFEDGVAVYVPETCETHLLPLVFAGLFQSGFAHRPPMPGEDDLSESTEPRVDMQTAMDELAVLKIIEPLA